MHGGYGCIILHRRSNVQNIFRYSLHFFIFFVTHLRYVNQRFPKIDLSSLNSCRPGVQKPRRQVTKRSFKEGNKKFQILKHGKQFPAKGGVSILLRGISTFTKLSVQPVWFRCCLGRSTLSTSHSHRTSSARKPPRRGSHCP